MKPATKIAASERIPAIRLHGVARRFADGSGETEVLRQMELMVEAGETLALTGASGSGKTTLLNIIAGLDRPTEGEVVVFGAPLHSMSDAERAEFRASSLGLVFQDSHLLPGLTALENVVAARLPWERGASVENRARELLASVGLASRAHFLPSHLSGGERQRVAIARALVGQPRLLLADEPTGNLDEETTHSILRLLDDLRTVTGLTMIIATHDPEVAAHARTRRRLHEGLLGSV